MKEHTCKFIIDKTTYSKRSLEQHDVSKKKPLVYPKQDFARIVITSMRWKTCLKIGGKNLKNGNQIGAIFPAGT